MSDLENAKQDFIDKLDNADRTFKEIFNVDNEGLVIQGKEKESLQDLYAKNQKMLRKLKTNEFTVAVVGLEKAGKSTLGNALIKSMVLPEYSERCTYTTTEIRSGDTDIAEVHFFSREEFNKNFKRMLNEVKYPDVVDFSTMTVETFNRYWKSVETDPDQSEFKTYKNDTAEDIKTMLEGKQKLIPLLGHEVMEFGAEYWTDGDDFNEFKAYITGMSGKNADGSVIRQPYPYAVKNVIIHSKHLKEMKHIVLYDVPGFDSPTELHKRQTEEKLKEADAIILVTNVADKPNLNGPQLDMLRKVQDPYGIKLSEKAFVFGNKIDRALDINTAKNNFATLRNESVNKYQIAASNRVVCGSARAYLEKEGLLSGNIASKIIDDWQLEFGDGVKVLNDKMQYYYDNDRFEVLKRRAENTLAETREVLQNLLERYNTGEFNTNDIGADILMEIQSRLPKFIRKANAITKNYTDQIINEAPFTKDLKNDIERIYPLVNDENGHQQLIQEIEYSLAIDPDGIYPANTVNGNVRDKLSKIFVKNIVESASKLTVERQLILRQELVAAFLDIMGMEQSTTYKNEVVASVNKLFDDMLIEGGSKCNFNSLVERFVTTLIQTLILMSFADEQRRDKVKTTLAELVSLSVYYNMPDKSEQESIQPETIGDNSVNFFAKILAHEGITSTNDDDDVDATENENFLRKLFEENREQICKGASVAIDLLPFGKWAKLIMKAGINLTEMQADKSIKGRDKLSNKLEDLFYSNIKWTTFSENQRKQAIDEVINNYKFTNRETDSTKQNNSLISKFDEFHERAVKAKHMQNKDDMIATLDTDIKILRDITDKAVIKAIGLERAFISVVTKNVELIREKLQDDEGGNKAFRDWIIANAFKFMPSKFESINETRAINENRKAIVNSIKKVLSNWDI